MSFYINIAFVSYLKTNLKKTMGHTVTKSVVNENPQSLLQQEKNNQSHQYIKMDEVNFPILILCHRT